MNLPAHTKSRTWVETTWQFIFEDDEAEIVATVGNAVPANTGDGLQINLDWQTEVPSWAENMSDHELIDLLGLGDAYNE